MTEDLKFRNVNAIEFAEIWNKFDINQSGYLEGNEVEAFFYELAKSLLKKEPTEEEHQKIKTIFMSAYNADEKISLNTLAKMLLPVDETFLLLFRRKIPLDSSVKFMQIWRRYDKNSSGFISVDELKDFIADYVFAAGASVTQDKLKEYAESIVAPLSSGQTGIGDDAKVAFYYLLVKNVSNGAGPTHVNKVMSLLLQKINKLFKMKLFDRNGDGLLDLQDMARLVNISENFLLQFKVQDGSLAARRRDFEKIFCYYDQSKTEALEGAEVDGFVKDIMEAIKGPISASELDQIKEKLLQHLDKNSNGKIEKAELAVFLGIR